MHPHFGVQLLADQGAGQRRVDTDQALFQVQLVGADDAVARLFAVFVFDGDPGTEVHLVRIGRLVADDLELFQTLGEKAHATVDLAQHLLAVGVLAPHYQSY